MGEQSIIQKPLVDPSDTEALENAAWVEPPFTCDYGYKVELGEGVFINFNCTILDTCQVGLLPGTLLSWLTSQVKIGARTLFGPSVSLFTASHPLSAAVRNGTKGPESGAPITIGEDCWICGNVIVLPGVTIGNGSVVGAGSVVTRDVPPNCVVAGNPAKIIKRLEVEDPQTQRLDGESKGELKKEPKKEPKDEPRGEGSATEVKKLLERLERLESEMKSVKEELKKHL